MPLSQAGYAPHDLPRYTNCIPLLHAFRDVHLVPIGLQDTLGRGGGKTQQPKTVCHQGNLNRHSVCLVGEFASDSFPGNERCRMVALRVISALLRGGHRASKSLVTTRRTAPVSNAHRLRTADVIGLGSNPQPRARLASAL